MENPREQDVSPDSFDTDAKENIGVGEEEIPRVVEQPIAPMNGTQKMLIWSLVGIGVAVLVLSGLQLKSIVTLPWPDLGTEAAATDTVALDLAGDAEAMKNKDTDADGISDYDELTRYKTSPYLADSDSDGTNDKDEVLIGEDPNCPKGEQCYTTAAPDTSLSPEIEATPGSTETATSPTTTVRPTATQLRDLVRKSGKYTEEQIAALTDEVLLNTYDEALKQNPTFASDIQSTNTGIQQYTPDQIRTLLKQEGIDEETLKQIDDATLVEMYQQALTEAAASSSSSALDTPIP